MLPEFEAEILSPTYTDNVHYRLRMPTKHVERFSVRVTDLTDGQAHLQVHQI